jgi:hypothetical protein
MAVSELMDARLRRPHRLVEISSISSSDRSTFVPAPELGVLGSDPLAGVNTS